MSNFSWWWYWTFPELQQRLTHLQPSFDTFQLLFPSDNSLLVLSAAKRKYTVRFIICQCDYSNIKNLTFLHSEYVCWIVSNFCLVWSNMSTLKRIQRTWKLLYPQYVWRRPCIYICLASGRYQYSWENICVSSHRWLASNMMCLHGQLDAFIEMVLPLLDSNAGRRSDREWGLWQEKKGQGQESNQLWRCGLSWKHLAAQATQVCYCWAEEAGGNSAAFTTIFNTLISCSFHRPRESVCFFQTAWV